MMLESCLFALLATASAPDGGASSDSQHAGHHAQVDARGDHAMGFSHERTAHHFLLTREGGVILAEARDPSDGASRDAIRGHFAHIAGAFAAGDFALPALIHARNPPGVRTMQRLRERIQYRLEDTPRGARVVIGTRDAEALDAVHAFLRFQIADHRTGDPVDVQGAGAAAPTP